MTKNNAPSEYAEMCALADVLDRAGLVWCHVPNEGRRSLRRGAQMKRMGVKAGVPDVLIFGRIADNDDTPRAAIELKRRGSAARPSPAQASWLASLALCGWCVCVAAGSADAVRWLREIGVLR